MVQIFWTRCILFVHKIWAGSESLDQVYFIHTKIMAGPVTPNPVFFIRPDNLGRSINCGEGVFQLPFSAGTQNRLLQISGTRIILVLTINNNIITVSRIAGTHTQFW